MCRPVPHAVDSSRPAMPSRIFPPMCPRCCCASLPPIPRSSRALIRSISSRGRMGSPTSKSTAPTKYASHRSSSPAAIGAGDSAPAQASRSQPVSAMPRNANARHRWRLSATAQPRRPYAGEDRRYRTPRKSHPYLRQIAHSDPEQIPRNFDGTFDGMRFRMKPNNAAIRDRWLGFSAPVGVTTFSAIFLADGANFGNIERRCPVAVRVL